MKITDGQLRRIVREELNRSLLESAPVPYYPPGDPRGELRQVMQTRQQSPVDPRFEASLETYQTLLFLLRQLRDLRGIAMVRSSGALQSGEVLAYDPVIKVLWIKWEEQGRPAMKWTYISDPDFLSRNAKQVRPILEQLNALDFPTFDKVAPNAFVSYIDNDGVRFDFPERGAPPVFGFFRDGPAMSSVPDVSTPGFIFRRGLTKFIRFDQM